MNLTSFKKQIKKVTAMTHTNFRKALTKLVLIATLFLSYHSIADTGRYRVMFGNDPSTEMTIGFDAYELGTNPVVYYSTTPIDINRLSTYSSQEPSKTVNYHTMINCFVRLTNLQPGQTYYFVVKDNSSISEIYNFETIPNDDDTQLSILAGGDSRNNRVVVKIANKIVAKLNAHAIMFDGDFVNNGNNPLEWQGWLDDWQYTISSNNRLTPIIPARGNHENNNEMLVNIFDCPSMIIYSRTLGNNLLDVYTLNSEMALSYASTQTAWLEKQLSNSNSTWKLVQYHKPIRPHVSRKKEGSMQYSYWANIFYKYGVDAVLEGDCHIAKLTWPIVPCSGGFDCDEGFKRDDYNGTEFHQFKWIIVNKNKMEARTVKYDATTNTSLINQLSSANRFSIPQNLEIWNPSNGDVVTLSKPTSNAPTCTLTTPSDNEMYFNLNNIKLSANTTGASSIAKVKFYVNGNLRGIDTRAPYTLNWQPPSYGVYIISAIVRDVDGSTSNFDYSVIKIANRNNIVHTSTIDIGSDECIEYVNERVSTWETVRGYVSMDEAKIRICEPGVSLQGLRFKEINIPPNAIINSAFIQFNPVSGSDPARTTIWCENSANSLPFISVPFNITERQKTSSSVAWNNIAAWNDFTTMEDAKSPDLKTLIQELIQHSGWTIESPVTFLINGTGKRNATSSIKNSSLAPKLIVRFSVPDSCIDPNACNYEATTNNDSCLYPGDSCDDGNPVTINDRFDENCDCKGQIQGCTNRLACNFEDFATIDDGTCVLCDFCEPLSIDDIALRPYGNTVGISWIADEGATYEFYYRKSGEINFKTYVPRISYIILFGLDNCTTYEFGFKKTCSNGVVSEMSELIDHTTLGCMELRENIYQNDEAKLRVYPQPATDYITIELAGNKKADLVNIYDLTGQLVINQNSISFDGSVYKSNVDHLSPGVYFVKAIIDNNTVTKKILVK